jgi:hypothetical protein
VHLVGRDHDVPSASQLVLYQGRNPEPEDETGGVLVLLHDIQDRFADHVFTDRVRIGH